MTKAAARPIQWERPAILGSLLVLAAAAWALLAWRSRSGEMDASLTMGMEAPLFIALWIAMMVAIMYPTAAPMIMMFARIHGQRRERGQSFVPTWVFAGSYMLVWSATGIAAFAIAVAGDRLAGNSAFLSEQGARIGGLLLIAAGVYQLTPLKTVCLSKCRSPLTFVLNSWRDGMAGAFRMGVDHGVYCLGCCWLLFLILFPLGMMNIAILALVTVVIYAEKALPAGRQAAYLLGGVLVVYGLVVVVFPGALPGMGDGMAMEGTGAMDGMEGMQ
jgi:predicted metal-binding membrane protein